MQNTIPPFGTRELKNKSTAKNTKFTNKETDFIKMKILFVIFVVFVVLKQALIVKAR